MTYHLHWLHGSWGLQKPINCYWKNGFGVLNPPENPLKPICAGCSRLDSLSNFMAEGGHHFPQFWTTLDVRQGGAF